MKADLYSKISKFSLWGFAILILVVFAFFFFVGDPLILEQVSEATGEVTEVPYPAYTELTLYLCYAMFFMALFLVGVFETVAFVRNLIYNPMGMLKKVIPVVLVAVAAFGLYCVSPSKLDFVLYLQYVLFGLAALFMLCSFLISKIRS